MLENFIALPSAAHTSIGLLLGLMVGSFLNVVIFRFPKILAFQWTQQSHEWINKEPYTAQTPPTLSKPASHCGNCKAPIKPWQNIPLLSYLALRGKCASCKTHISLRYPFVELLTAVLTAYVVHHFGFTPQACFAMVLTWVLITLTFIDFDHQLLPDDIVLPTMWLGLGLSLWGVYTSPQGSILGAIVGYLCFWLVFHVFRILTGKEGMGHGDFKLMALLGAWLGWQYLPQIVLVSTLLGSVIGIFLMVLRKAKSDLAIPFGPYIAFAGWVALIWGEEINRFYLQTSGL
ncbi:MAG: leader peptidase (prepilin peptidase)/N-methyltransferase [Cryomorphaceae bacterium]|jgi:leader peptidase (prepilin peptidase)/N-methyltransferase